MNLPPALKEEKLLLKALLRQGLIKENPQTQYEVHSGFSEDIQILRKFPNYEIFAIQIKPCTLDLEILSLQGGPSSFRVQGKEKVRPSSLFSVKKDQKGWPPLAPDCRNKENLREWMLISTANGYQVEQKN